MDPLQALLSAAVTALILAAGYLAGSAARWALSRGLSRLGLNQWFRNFNVGKAILRSGYTPAEFFGGVAAWLIYVSAVLLAASYLARSLGLAEVADGAVEVLRVYVAGFAKFFVTAIIGFVLVDGFADFIYKGSFTGERTVGLVAEYIRIVLYLAVITFALEVGGINVATLSAMVTPIVWGLTAAIVAAVVAAALRR